MTVSFVVVHGSSRRTIDVLDILHYTFHWRMEPMVILPNDQHERDQESILVNSKEPSYLRRQSRNTEHTPVILLQRLKAFIMPQQLGDAKLPSLDPARTMSRSGARIDHLTHQNFFA